MHFLGSERFAAVQKGLNEFSVKILGRQKEEEKKKKIKEKEEFPTRCNLFHSISIQFLLEPNITGQRLQSMGAVVHS